MNNNGNSGEMAFAFLLGGIVGGVLGVLLAPSAGKKTRGELAKLLRNLLDSQEDLIEEGKDKILQEAKKISMAAQAAKKAYQG